MSKYYTDQDIVNEIIKECENLRAMGVDLSKIGFQIDTNARKSKFDPGLLAEYDAVRKQLIESVADLSKIKIVEAH